MGRLRVVMYHKVSESHKDFLTVTQSQLHDQLQWLKQQFTPVTLRQVVGHIELGEALPDKALLITFDDGYENNFTFAYPLFKQMGIPFSIFLIGDCIGHTMLYDGTEQSFLSEHQLEFMQDFAQYGYHSKSHNNLMQLEEKDWTKEIASGMDSLKNLPVTIEKAWAYTYGSFPKRDKNQFNTLSAIFQSQGINTAFRIGNRINKLPLEESLAIQRIDVRGDESWLKFKFKVKWGKPL